MKRKFLPALAAVGMAMVISRGAYAAEVGTLEGFKSCLGDSTETTCTLTEDITLTGREIIRRDVTIDLNGHNITASASNFDLFGIYGGKVTVTGEGTVGSETSASPFGVYGTTDESVTEFSVLTVDENVTLKADDYAIWIPHNSKTVSYGAVVNFKGTIQSTNGFYINGNLQAVAENAPKINILDGAQVKTSEHEVYAAGYGIWNFGEANLEGGEGVGLKAGKFEFNNTNIKVTGAYVEPVAWGDGINGSGATIQIESHDSYADNVEVKINGGTYTSENGHVIYEYKAKSDTQNAVQKFEIIDGKFTSGEGKDVFQVSDNFTLERFIEGGEFSTLPKLEYVKDGKEVYDKGPDGPYFVDDDVEITYPETILVEVGKDYELETNEIVKKYATVGPREGETFTLDGFKLTATKTGEEEIVNINFHDYITPVDENIKVKTYEIKLEVKEVKDDDGTLDEVTEETEDVLKDYALAQVKKVLDGEEADKGFILYRDADYIKEALANGRTIEIVVDKEAWDLDDNDERGYFEELFSEQFEDEDFVAGAYWAGVELLLTDENGQGGWERFEHIGSISELPEKIEVSFEVADKYLTTPEGYERKFYVIRAHFDPAMVVGVDDAEFTRIAVELDGNMVKFENDLFSEFTIVYQDTEEETGGVVKTADTGRFTNLNEGGVVPMNLGSFIVKKSLAIVLGFVGIKMLMFSLARAKREKNL